MPELEKSYLTALEQLSASHLRTDKIKLLLHNEAKKGHRAVRIPLPDGIDLRKTDGARLFLDWVKANGLRVDWISRLATIDGGRQATGYDVELSWGPVEFRP